MNKILGIGITLWLNLVLVFLVLNLSISFTDVFNIRKISTDLIIKSIIVAVIMFIIILLNIYFTRGMKKSQKILFIVFSNGLVPVLYFVATRSLPGMIISVCYTLSLLWILKESKKDGRGAFWNVVMFGWNSQNKITNLLALGVFLAAMYSAFVNPQPYVQTFKNMSLNMAQVDIKNILSNETIEAFLPEIVSKHKIEEQVLAYNCGNDTACRSVLRNTSQFQQAVEDAYNKQIELRELTKQKIIEQLEAQNNKTQELMEYMLTKIPITKMMIENIHWLVALTASAIIILYGKIILGPVFVLLSILSYRLISKRDSWEELVEFIQMRFR